MPKFRTLKEFKIEGQPDMVVGQEIEMEAELASPLVADGTLEVVVEPPKPELTEAEKTTLRRNSMFADMMVSFRQDVEGIGMNMERLMVNKRFWQYRFSQVKGKNSDVFKKAEESLMAIEKQFAENRLALQETKKFMEFLDGVMRGETVIDFEDVVEEKKAAEVPVDASVELPAESAESKAYVRSPVRLSLTRRSQASTSAP